MKKIVFYDYIHHYGGAQRSTITILDNLVQLGNNVVVVDPCGKIPNFENDVKKVNCEYHTYNREYTFESKSSLIQKMKSLLLYLIDIITFAYFCFVNKPDVIFTNSHKAIFPLLLGKLFSNGKIYFYIRGIKENEDIMYKSILNKYFNKIFVQSMDIKSYVISNSIDEDKIFVIPNAISDEFINKKYNLCSDIISHHTEYKIVIISSIIPNKGYSELILALNELKKQVPKFKLFIVGDFISEAYKIELMQIIEANDLIDKIIFLGVRNDIGEILSSSDVFILPSYNEGTPRSIMEAMAVEKPIIATNVGGIPSLIKDDFSGYIINPRSHDDIYRKLLYVYNNRELALKVALNGKNSLITNFTMKIQKNNLKNYF